MARLTTEEFIEKARKVHGDKYDYSKVEYKNAHTKVCIICPEHGEFWQTPNTHLYLKCECSKCMKNAKGTTDEFIERARKIHINKYDYSKVEYINSKTKVCIICPEHGEFWQTPDKHLYGQGCPICGNDKQKSNTEEFIRKANKIHSNKYDYSKVNYVNSHTKVCIICPEHGEFWQKPNGHLNGQGCPSCNKITSDDFIQKATLIHNGKYDYSKVDYKTAKTKVCIICPEHGEFWQAPDKHLSGCGCQKCGGTKKLSIDEFISKANEIHNNKYDYSKVKYINNQTKVCIICPEHGEFWQTPGSHLSGKGCPHCLSSKIEDIIETKLNEINVNFEKQKTFDWLKSKRNMRLDFYLPEYNIAIECQGKQHFDNIEYFGGNDGLKYRKYNDMIKLKLCKEHNVNLLYFNYNEDINDFEQKLKEYGIL